MPRLILICIFSILSLGLYAQTSSVYVDDQGIMRWSSDSTELHGFGVNYTLPFAHEYRMAKKSGISIEEAIRQDVYHMARLDLDLYRVHVWDTEISDTLGNLLNNEHLRLFDFTIHEMKKRGMMFIITPIAYWGNGWPEPDEKTPGFSRKYGKEACLTNPSAIDAQANYLRQFLNHVNPYTGIAYKDEPRVIGFEICNEPHHSGAPAAVTAFINRMAASIRQTGCTKLIFYNMSHSIHLAEAYLAADIQGGTFQWYPTGLVAGHQINGNFLPRVKEYKIPFAGDPKFKKMAKIIYEFDAADAGGNILYPAMAHAFREAGMQLATQFEYDALCQAAYNTNYGTHFMNLAYAPHKAISLKIASAVFHTLPMYHKSGNQTHFGDFRISYRKDLAEWLSAEKFFYSNTTASHPPDESRVREIAGCGSSPLVSYTGTGAYFLDKLSDGVWRLEVMPDVYWIEDPYSPVDPHKQKAAVNHAVERMNISLKNLGSDFSVTPVNKGNTFKAKVQNGQFDLIAGVYLLRRSNVKAGNLRSAAYKNIMVDEFVAPPSNLPGTVLWNHTPTSCLELKTRQMEFEAASPYSIKNIEVAMNNGSRWKTIDLSDQGNHLFKVNIPSELLGNGFLQYKILVETDHDTTVFPSGKTGNPGSWDKKDNIQYSLSVLPGNSALPLWNAGSDWEKSMRTWNRNINLAPDSSGNSVLHIHLDQWPHPDPENQNGRQYAFTFYFGDKIRGRSEELLHKKRMGVLAWNSLQSQQQLEIGLIDGNGRVMAGKFEITSKHNLYMLPLESFKPAPYLIIPRSYPDFLPYQVLPDQLMFDWSSVEILQVVLRPGAKENTDLKIEKIWLE